MIWAGRGAAHAEPSPARFTEHLGAPVAASFGGRGCPPTTHPLAVGLPPHEPEVAELIAAADVLLAVGGDLDSMHTRNWTMPRPPRLVVVDTDAGGSEWTPDVAVSGRIGDTLRGLRARLPGRAAWAPPDLQRHVRARLADDPRTAEAFALVAAVEAARTDETVLVCDMAVAGYRVGGDAAAPGPGDSPTPSAGARSGSACPQRSAPPPPAIPSSRSAVTGLAMAVGEPATLVQERLPVVVLVVDDGGYRMPRYAQLLAGPASTC